MKERNFAYIANEIIKIIKDECTFAEYRIKSIIERIEKVIHDSSYKAPELQWMSWDELSDILRTNFVPSNSKWETKIMIVFNDLSGTIDDYWDDGTNSLKEVSK